MIESIIRHTGGESWLEMKLIWEETDIDTAWNRSKLRLMDVQFRSTTGSTVGRNLNSDGISIYVNETLLVTFGWYELTLTGGVPAEFTPMTGVDFGAKIFETDYLQHAPDGTLSAAIRADCKFVYFEWTSTGGQRMENFWFYGTGSAEAGRIDTESWLTEDGIKAFLLAAGGAVSHGIVETSLGEKRAEVTEYRVSGNGVLSVNLQIIGLETPATVTKAMLCDGEGKILVVKKDTFAVQPGQQLLYRLLFGMTGK